MAGGQGEPHTMHEQGTMDHGLWLLTNQLYWPASPNITPALRFRFAVDGGSGILESACINFRSIPKKSYCGQVIAATEGSPPPESRDAVRDRDAGQAAACIEGITPDACNTVTNCDARQASAFAEGTTPDTGNAVGDRHARQAVVSIEGHIADAGDAIRDRDTGQAGAEPEGRLSDAGDTLRDRDTRQA